MPAQVFGIQADVSMLNRAFNDQSPSYNVYVNQERAAGTTAESTRAFAMQFGAGFTSLSEDKLSTLLLTNMGVRPNAGLQAALKDHIAFVGKAQVGVVALQLAQLLSGLENAVGEQAVFNAAAVAWNKEVTDSYNYSSNPDNKGSVGPITNNQLVGIASSEGYPMDGMGPGGWPA